MPSEGCRVDSTLDDGRVRRTCGRRRHRWLFHGPAGGTARQARGPRGARRTAGWHLSPARLHPDEGIAAVSSRHGHREPCAGVGHQGIGRSRLVGGARVRGQDRRQAGQRRHRADQEPRHHRPARDREAPRRPRGGDRRDAGRCGGRRDRHRVPAAAAPRRRGRGSHHHERRGPALRPDPLLGGRDRSRRRGFGVRLAVPLPRSGGHPPGSAPDPGAARGRGRVRRDRQGVPPARDQGVRPGHP